MIGEYDDRTIAKAARSQQAAQEKRGAQSDLPTQQRKKERRAKEETGNGTHVADIKREIESAGVERSQVVGGWRLLALEISVRAIRQP